MEAQQQYHDTCTYCIHNKNPNRLSYEIKCNLKDDGECNYWSKNRFKCVSEEEVKELDEAIENRNRSYRNQYIAWKVSTIGIITSWIGIGIIAILTSVLSLKLRFSNPELTETQLFLEFTHRYPALTVILIGLIIIDFIFGFIRHLD